MSKFKLIIKTTGSIFFVIVFIFFSTLNAKNPDKFNKADKIADYFSGILLLNQSQYEKSYQYFKKLDGLEKSHSIFSSKYIYSLVNSGNFYQAFHFSKKWHIVDPYLCENSCCVPTVAAGQRVVFGHAWEWSSRVEF